MSESKNIKNITVSDAMVIINDLVVSSLIKGVFTIEAVDKDIIALLVNGLYFQFMHFIDCTGKRCFSQSLYSSYKIGESVIFLTYDKEEINPILEKALVTSERDIKIEHLRKVKLQALELELELELELA